VVPGDAPNHAGALPLGAPRLLALPGALVTLALAALGLRMLLAALGAACLRMLGAVRLAAPCWPLRDWAAPCAWLIHRHG